MAKVTGFAALAALQTKTTDSIEEPIESTTDSTGEDLGDVTDTPVVAPAQPTFDSEVVEPVRNGGIRLLNDLAVTEWTTKELEAYIAGTVAEDTYLATIKAAIKEHLIRETKLSNAWSIEECREFLKSGATPAKTSKGAWINDITRHYRREHEWETNELESWALGEIKAEGATTNQGLAVELKRRLNLQLPGVDVEAVIVNYRHTTGQATKTVVEARPEPVTATITTEQITEVTKSIQLEGITHVNQSYIDSSLAEYAKVMQVGRAVSEATAGQSQRLLRDVLLYAIALPDPVGARNAMQYLVDYFRSKRAVGQLFEDTYAFRGINDMPRTTKAQQTAHHDLLTVFLVFADPMVELRAQTDVMSLISGVGPQYQSRVLEFFSKVQ